MGKYKGDGTMLYNRKIVIIGAGHVGTHCAAALSFQNICDEIVLQHGRKNVFFQVIQMFDSFSFSKSKDGNVCISLNLDKMWERTNE